MAERKLKVGDRVKWNSSGGQAEGKIVRVARESGSIKGFDYKASSDDPRYIVETDEGKHAAHKAEELRRA
jgi:hypothetical protein